MATPQTEVPPNAFQPNNTVEAMEPIDERQTLDEDDIGAPLLDEGGDGAEDYTDPTPEEKAKHAEAAQATEKEARGIGWISKAEWVEKHGSDKGWKSAFDYVDFRAHVLPVVQKEARELRAKVAALEAKDRARDAELRARDARIETAALSTELREAAEAGDWTRFAELDEKRVKALVGRAAPPVAAPVVDPEVKRIFSDFIADNAWLKNDEELQAAFTEEVTLIGAAKTATTVIDALEKAAKRVRRLYADHPAIRKTPSRALGESGGESTRMNGGKNHSWANLKSEYRSQAESDIRNGRYTQKEYLANCDDDAFRT